VDSEGLSCDRTLSRLTHPTASGHSFACLGSIAIAANALFELIVFLLDPAIEVRRGGTLRRAGVGDGLARRCQVIFVQEARVALLGPGVGGPRGLRSGRERPTRGYERLR
jgi:hypothetical protein